MFLVSLLNSVPMRMPESSSSIHYPHCGELIALIGMDVEHLDMEGLCAYCLTPIKLEEGDEL